MLMDTGTLIITSVQPGNAVNIHIVFILVFNAGHRRFTCHQCLNLNLREISESESDALRIHDYHVFPIGLLNFWSHVFH